MDHTAGASGDFSGLDVVPMFTLASWRAAAGLNADGFTAYPDKHPCEGGDPEYRQCERGDIIQGVWVLQELQAGLKALKWTLGNAEWTDNGEASSHEGSGVSNVSLADAESLAQTDYDTPPYDSTGSNAEPRARTDWQTATGYGADVWRRKAYGRWSWPELGGLTKIVDFYTSATFSACPDHFDANGDFPGGYTPNTLYRFDTTDSGTGTEGLSDCFGKGPPGNYPAWEPSPSSDSRCGYDAHAVLAVVQWSFEYA